LRNLVMSIFVKMMMWQSHNLDPSSQSNALYGALLFVLVPQFFIRTSWLASDLPSYVLI
jgi:hypothetical protein